MFDLSAQDLLDLEEISKELSLNQEDTSQILDKLIRGFQNYSDEELLKKFSSRKKFFKSHASRLLENWVDAGKTSNEVFSDLNNRNIIKELVCVIKGVAIFHKDLSEVEDATQEIIMKLIKYRWAERYNPLLCSWKQSLAIPVRNYLRTRRSRVSLKANTIDVSWEMIQDTIFIRDDDFSPDQKLLIDEFINEWEDFLEKQPPFRKKLRRDFRDCATLLSPGIPEFPVTEETPVFFISETSSGFHITTRELYEKGISHKVPESCLVDYFSEDPRTGVILINEKTGLPLIQKTYPNPEYIENQRKEGRSRFCTLLPPGTPEIPTNKEMELYFLGGGSINSKVATPMDYARGQCFLVPNHLLVDYIKVDPVTGMEVEIRETGEFFTQKFYMNQNNSPENFIILEKRIIHFYRYLREDLTIEEVSSRFQVSLPLFFHWLRKLEKLFQAFWLITDRIPSHLKSLAVETYKCPSCNHVFRKHDGFCKHCNVCMDGQIPKIRLDLYPWSPIYRNLRMRNRNNVTDFNKSKVSIPVCQWDYHRLPVDF